MARTLMPCGTVAAYERHRRAGEEACEACREARRAYSNARYIPRNRERPVCGTPAAYHWHLRHGEETCQPCRDAWNARRRSLRLSQMISDVWVQFGGESGAGPCES